MDEITTAEQLLEKLKSNKKLYAILTEEMVYELTEDDEDFCFNYYWKQQNDNKSFYNMVESKNPNLSISISRVRYASDGEILNYEQALVIAEIMLTMKDKVALKMND